MEDLGFIGVPGAGGAVGVQDQGSAPSVNYHLMVEEQHAVFLMVEEQHAVFDAGFVNIPAGCSVNLSLIS